MDMTNQKIINAIIEKANKVCPESLALIGIYGSVATGDVYEKSDLDLLILIQNDEGWKLGAGFILDDKEVGYDIYCTNWSGLRYDAECHHAHISKLMDSQIVYVNNQEAYKELLQLRRQAKQFLESEERFQRANELVNKAKTSYANACLCDELGQVRLEAFGVIHYLLDAVMLYHGSYFKRGVKRTFEELATLPLDDMFTDTIRKIVVSKDIFELRDLLKILILYTASHTRREKPKTEASDALAGTYEEMYSNWRNKVEEAAENEDAFASFANMCNLHFMFKEISEEVEIGTFDIMDAYSSDSLEDNIRTFDRYLQKYEEVYARAGIRVKRFADVDEFVDYYLSK
jgi:predicted nucleotidyltransferase